ncbi:MAG: hypothetical protein AB1762_06295 [Gemmatimonadota bacterium]
MIRPRLAAVALVLACLTSVAHAQNEAALRAAFEGKTVTVKIDMPGTSRGVDIFPMNATPLDYRELANRLKEYGTALKPGQSAMITKVVVKGKSHIEFQLGGGGYGTFGDAMNDGSTVYAPDLGETKAEKALRDSIKAASCCPTRRKAHERELASLRAARERENAAAEAQAAQANEAREANLRVKRLESGSRFNIRYREGLTAEALTPDGVKKALAQYVEFGAPTTVAAGGSGAGGFAALKKGLSLKDVEALLGPASSAGEAKEGAMTVMKRTYKKDGMVVTAKFVSDVLIDFTIAPQ